MAIPIQFIPEIPESKLSSSLQSKVNSGGSGNTNIVVVSLEADIYNIVNSNKILEFQTDITLTANRTLPTNITLKWGGGKIILNGFTLTGDETKLDVPEKETLIDAFDGIINGTWDAPSVISIQNFGTRKTGLKLEDGNITLGTTTFTSNSASFTSSDIGKFIAIIGAGGNPDAALTQGYVHRTQILSITNSTTVELADAAITTANDQIFVYGWDDYTAIFNAAYVRNQKSGTLIFPTGDYWHKTVQNAALWSQEPTGWLLGNGTNNVHWLGTGGKLRLIPHETPQSKTVTIYKTKNSSIKNMFAFGDYTYYPSENGKTEGNHFMFGITLTYDITIENNYVEGYFGDAISHGGDSQFTNYIKGNGTGASNVAIGNIDDLGILDTNNTDYIYTTEFLPITTYQFTRSQEIEGNKYFQLTASSFSGWGGLLQPYFWAVFYDASYNFLYRTQKQTHYDKVFWRDNNVAYVKIVMPKVRDITLINLQVRPDASSERYTIISNEFTRCGRQGISNPPGGSKVLYNYIHDIGGLAAGPGYGIDIEDGSQLNRDILILGNIFRNNWGDITLIGAENISIINNHFLRNTRDQNIYGAPTQTYQAAVDASLGRNIIITGNLIEYKRISLDRQDVFHGNRMNGGVISYRSNNNSVKNNKLRNVRLSSTTNTADRIGYPTLIEDNEFSYNQANDGAYYWFTDNNNSAIVKNNRFIFNDISQWSFEAVQSDGDLESGVGNNKLFVKITQNVDNGGYWENNIFKGILPPLASRDYDVGTASFLLTNYDGDIIDHPISFQSGLAQDYKMKFKTHWVWFQLTDFESTIISATPTISIHDSEFIVDSRYLWTNNSSSVVEIDSRNVNFEFINTIFDLQVASTVTGGGNKYFDWRQLGTTLLENCTFKSVTAKVIDFTDTSIYPSDLGNIFNINPIVDGISFILRSQDKIVFTKASPLMATYAQFADEAAATTAGYPSGYMYMTPTGEYRVKL